MPHGNKLNVTRPEFLLHLMGNDMDRLSDDIMRKPLCDDNVLSYCAYTVLMDANVQDSKIDNISADGESLAIRFHKKSDAQAIAAQCHREKVRYGNKTYTIHTKVRDRYIVLSIDEGVKCG